MGAVNGVRFAKFEFYRTTVNEVRIRKVEFYGKLINLDYSRIEFARLPRSARDDNFIIAQVVKSARPNGKLCRHIIKRNAFETD